MRTLFRTILAGMLIVGSLNAQCVGSSSFSNCWDNSGNSYTVQRFGNTTVVNGSASNGNTWSQTSQTFGNTTYTNATSADGSSWNQTTIRTGNSITTYGTDSNGNSFYGSHYD
jgi:hypothetical protein